MKNLLLFVSMALFVVSCGGQASERDQDTSVVESSLSESGEQTLTADENAPVVAVEQDTYDFGQANEGDKVKHVFEFTNNGQTPLIISSVQASCGCTTPDYPKQPIKPGESSKIEVVFNTSNQPGMQHKVITMISNANPNQTIFHLKGEVKQKQ